MSSKLNMKNLGKLEADGVYIVQFTRRLTKEETDGMVHQFDLLHKKHGAQFVMFNHEMELLDPKNCKDIFIEVLHQWESNRLKIVR